MDDFNPPVSLILPAYNEEEIIGKSVSSGLEQDYVNLEILVVDDGSTDKTAEIVKKYVEHDKRVTLIQHNANLGKPEALNTGFRNAKGEISIFADSDSFLSQNFISETVKHFRNPNVGMVAGMIVIDNDYGLWGKCQQIEYLYSQYVVRYVQHLNQNVLICPGAGTAIRTEIARANPHSDRTITEDADLSFCVARDGWKIEQEINAMSFTDAPANYKDFVCQRKRWLYGVLQTLKLHMWRKDLWTLWAWIGYILCPLSLFFLFLIPFLLYFIGQPYFVFFAIYSLVSMSIFFITRAIPILQYGNGKKHLILLLPIYVFYQYFLQILLFYLIIANMTSHGITVRYGGRDIRAI